MIGSEIVAEKLQSDSKLYVIHQTSNLNDDFVKFQYYSYPIKTNKYYNQEELYDSEKITNQIIDLEKLLYDEYEYLFIIGTNDYFSNNYSHMFENNNISEWTLYKITKVEENKTIVLKEVNG